MAHSLDALGDLDKTVVAYLHLQDGHPVRMFGHPGPRTCRMFFNNGEHEVEYSASCRRHFRNIPGAVLAASNDEAAVVSALGEGAGAEMDDIAILTAVTAVLTASVADVVSSSAVFSVDESCCFPYFSRHGYCFGF